MSIRRNISVCICTYKRPKLLKRLLLEMESQHTDDNFNFSIVVVDNDKHESARQTVTAHKSKSKLSIEYHVQPEQNIALTRNKAIEIAQGDFIGFIDDDEFPAQNWLLNLYKVINDCNADGVLGPVLPHFENSPPKWILNGRFFERPTHTTGHILKWYNTRTGNTLLRKELFQSGHTWFDPNYGSGGEDRDFFKRKIENGHVFVWCNEAPVYETVPPERWKRKVMMKRALLRGKVAYENSMEKHLILIKSILAVLIYTAGLPVLLIIGHHAFMKYLVKDCDHIGNILAAVGVDIVKEKYVTAYTQGPG